MTELFLGLDLGWTTGATGLAVVDDTGRLLASGRVLTDDEIAAWVAAQPGRVVVAAVDAPLIVPNETGQRVPERSIGKTFGGFGASAHTSNMKKFGGEPPRALRLAERCGWGVDPHTEASAGAPVCIEVYPHPAMVGLFALGYRLDYKKGIDARRGPGFRALLEHLEAVPELRVVEHPRWRELRGIVAAPEPGDLNRVEDELDAIVCAHLAWLWHHRRDSLHVYGSLEDGYIVAPPPPTHKPFRRPLTTVNPAAPPPAAFTRTVAGRPTEHSGGTNEEAWKRVIRTAFEGCVLPEGSRVQVEVHFLLASDQVGRPEPDLGNLIKSTVDALKGVLGVRPGTGSGTEVDDVRVDRIVASKRTARSGEHPGARIAVSELPGAASEVAGTGMIGGDSSGGEP